MPIKTTSIGLSDRRMIITGMGIVSPLGCVVENVWHRLILRDQIVPATLNLENPDIASEGVDIVSGASRKMVIEHAMSNGFGFGGVNASVIFRQWSS